MKFVIYKDAAGGYRWHLVAKNGRIIADSGEAYHNPGNARRALKTFRDSVGNARIVEVVS